MQQPTHYDPIIQTLCLPSSTSFLVLWLSELNSNSSSSYLDALFTDLPAFDAFLKPSLPLIPTSLIFTTRRKGHICVLTIAHDVISESYVLRTEPWLEKSVKEFDKWFENTKPKKKDENREKLCEFVKKVVWDDMDMWIGVG